MSAPQPLVTITIPTFNQERYIARAITSALAQDYGNLEVVVVDDRSTDATLAVAQGFVDAGLRVFLNDSNLGRVRNYRRGLYELARGDWVVNLDGDDQYIDPHFISAAVEAVTADPTIVMYAAGSASLHEASGSIKNAPMGFAGDRLIMPGAEFVLRYPSLGATQHFSVLYNRSLALKTDFYSLDSLGTDTDSLLRLALKGKVVVDKRWVGAWTHHDHNASYSLDNKTVEKEIAMLRRVASALGEHVPQSKVQSWLRRLEQDKRTFAIILMLSRLPVGEAWRLLLRNLRPDARSIKEVAKLMLRTAGLR